MRGSVLLLGALGLCFAAASVCAKNRPKDPSKLTPDLLPANPGLSGIGRSAPDRKARGPSGKVRLSFTNESIVRFDGTAADRRAIVGSMPVMGPVAAELGLFSITGASPKERELKRNDPLADVQPRRSKVAAVGLRMSF